MAKIAFIGLGNMGGPMAANLVKNSHDVTGFDLSEKPMATLEKIGGKKLHRQAKHVLMPRLL